VIFAKEKKDPAEEKGGRQTTPARKISVAHHFLMSID
jgi:hypothetical protein